MKYMGSKNRHAKELLAIILKDRKPDQYYVEPFCGGCNMIDKVPGKRIANDAHKELIAMFKALQAGWIPPVSVSEEEYRAAKTSTDLTLKGYIGFNLSFGAKWFGGYRRDKEGIRDYSLEAYNNVTKQTPALKDVLFSSFSYQDLFIPDNSIVFCDPPYADSTGYIGGFDHEAFWNWVRSIHSLGHTVFVSEYSAPDDFECVWEKKVASSLTKDTGSKTGTEKLFTIIPELQ